MPLAAPGKVDSELQQGSSIRGLPLHLGVIGFDSGSGVRGSGPRKATIISLTNVAKKISAGKTQREFELAA